jgi:CDP-diacylglycerol--glycerol-3-phosphate 3-phosphatidyltransferase
MTDASAYGPSALATRPSALTVIRLLVSPILFVMIAHDRYSWAIFVLWCVLAGTDGVDGWIARRHGTTRSGVPRSAGRQGAGARRALLARVDRAVLLGAGGHHAGPGLFISCTACTGVGGLAVPARATARPRPSSSSSPWAALLPLLDTVWWPADVVLWASVAMALLSGVQYVLDGSRATTMEAA